MDLKGFHLYIDERYSELLDFRRRLTTVPDYRKFVTLLLIYFEDWSTHFVIYLKLFYSVKRETRVFERKYDFLVIDFFVQ